ncbi:MAG: hypothetical protein Kow0026_23440 [Oricola sp.]
MVPTRFKALCKKKAGSPNLIIEAEELASQLDPKLFYETVFRNGKLVIKPVPDVETGSNIKVHARATVVISDDRISTIILPEEISRLVGDEPRYLRIDRKNERLYARALDVPAYYLAGVSKKMDILDDWNDAFRTAAVQVRDDGATMLDYDRLHTVWQCVSNVANSSAPIAEIGVLRGGTSALIARAMEHFGKEGRLYSCDTFSGHEEVDETLDNRHKAGTFADRTSEQLVRDYLKPFPFVEILPGDIKKTIDRITEPELAMIHLDVDVFPTTDFVLRNMASRLIKGGMMLVDDYAVTSCPGVKQAVDEFVRASEGFSFFHLLTGQALLVRTG